MPRGLALIVGIAVGIGIAAPAAAQAPGPGAAPAKQRAARRITPAERARYAKALRAGRDRMKRRDLAGAIASFEAALAALPDDARALSELGWAAFKAGDLARARSTTERSIAAAGDPRLRAASLYNLGRVLEAARDEAGALDAYRRSLVLRANAVVRDRVVALDPEATPDEPIRPVALAGPFPTLQAYCKARPADEADTPCRLGGDAEPALPRLTLAPPYTGLAMLQTGVAESCSLGVRTAAGWYVHEAFAECRQMGGRWDRDVSVRALDLRDVVPGGAPEVVLELQVEESYNDTPAGAADEDMEITTESYTLLTVCGVGPSRAPSCTPAIVTGWTHGDGPASALDVKLGDGVLVLRLGAGGAAAGGAAPGVLGAHRLVFP